MKIQHFIVQYFRSRIKMRSLYSKQKAGNEAFKIFCTPYFRMVYRPDQIKDAQHLSFKFQGLATRGYRWNPGAGKKVLVAHGFRSAAVNFQHLAIQLASKGYEVIAFDAPAHGRSEGKMLTAIDYKNFIEGIRSSFGPFNAYLCHSFGGLAASMTLAEIDNASVKTVLIAPAANSRQLIESFFREMRISDASVQRHFYANIERLSGQDIAWFSIRRCASAMNGPLLWLHDYDDRITPISDALEVQRLQRPNFQFLFTHHLGHRRIYRDQEVISAILNFL